MEITRHWLTLKTIIFNTQNNVYGQWCGVLGRKTDLLACAEPNNVEMEMEDNIGLMKMEDNGKMEMDDELKMDVDDAYRTYPDLPGSGDAVRSEELTTVGFDLSAYAAFRFVGTCSDNVKMMEMDDEMEIFDTDRACPDLSGSGD
jgi:hypothetical protein